MADVAGAVLLRGGDTKPSALGLGLLDLLLYVRSGVTYYMGADAVEHEFIGVASSRLISSGAGLVGGGDLSADRTLAIAAADLTVTVNADSIQVGLITSANITDGTILNVDVNAAAAIAYSKLNLAAAIVNGDVSASAAIAYSKLALTASIVNADVAGAAAIAYSKLALTGAIVNADVASAAALAYSKLALTNSIVNGDISSGAAIAYSKLALAGTIVNADVNNAAAIAYTKLALTNTILNADINASAAIALSKLATQVEQTVVGVATGSGTTVPVALTDDQLFRIINEGLGTRSIVTSTALAAVTTEQVLASFSMPSTWAPPNGAVYKTHVSGVATQTAAAILCTARAKVGAVGAGVGGTNVGQELSTTPVLARANAQWTMNSYITVRTNGVAGTCAGDVEMGGQFFRGAVATTTTSAIAVGQPINTTIAQDIIMTWTWAAITVSARSVDQAVIQRIA